ncbi:hypothetical protein MTO96_010438 [Rhipicephalus appendiculatus]
MSFPRARSAAVLPCDARPAATTMGAVGADVQRLPGGVRGRRVHASTTQGYPFALFGAGGPAYLSDLTCRVDRRSTSSAKRRSARR